MALETRNESIFSREELDIADSLWGWDIKRLGISVANLYLRYIKACREIDTLRSRCEQAERQKTRIAEERDGLLKEKDRLEDQAETSILQAQQAAFDFNAQSNLVSEDDGVIRQKLLAITSQWKTFAKAWSITGQPPFQTLERGEDFVQICLRSYLSQDELEAADGILSPRYLSMMPRMLLHAELAHFVCWNLVEAPFLSLVNVEEGYETEPINDPGRPASILEHMTKEIARDNPAVAASWRAQTVSLFGVPFGNKEPTTTQVKARERRIARYKELADEFEQGQTKCLFRECTQSEEFERNRQLRHLLHDAGEAFTNLWMQKAGVGILQLEDFKKRPFKVGSPEYEPHNLLRLDSDERALDTRMDGKNIQFVIQPALVSLVTDPRQKIKIWARATVWVSSGRKAMPERTMHQPDQTSQRDAASNSKPPLPTRKSCQNTSEGQQTASKLAQDNVQVTVQTSHPGAMQAAPKKDSPASPTINSSGIMPSTLRTSQKPKKNMIRWVLS